MTCVHDKRGERIKIRFALTNKPFGHQLQLESAEQD